VGGRPELSVVIPTYNRAERLRYTLHSLAAQSLPAEAFEVVVVDDGSTDGSDEVVDGFRSRIAVQYTRLDRDEADIAANGYCVSRVRNAGLALARGAVIVFVDSGTLPGRHFLAAHRAEHAGSGPPRAVIGYTYGTHKFRPFPGLQDVLRNGSPEDAVTAIGDGPRGLDLRHDVFASGEDPARLAGAWMLFWTANASLPARVLHAAGGFDEAFRGWGYEDAELGYRLIGHGVRLTASRRAWAVEWPDRPDLTVVQRSAARNLDVFLSRHRQPAIELYASIRARHLLPAFERDHAELQRWCEQARGLDVRPELEIAAVSGRVCVLGSGAALPPGWPAATLVDFDAGLLARAPWGHPTVHAIGLRTGLPDAAFDVVVLTSRLRGLWPRWGETLLAEAGRIGGTVVVAFEP